MKHFYFYPQEKKQIRCVKVKHQLCSHDVNGLRQGFTELELYLYVFEDNLEKRTSVRQYVPQNTNIT